jgi:hypothetical protein
MPAQLTPQSRSNDYRVRDLSLEKDWPSMQALLKGEDWPFVKSDFLLYAAQDKFVGVGVYLEDQLVAFFNIHDFGSLAYLCMIIVHPDHRSKNIALMMWGAINKKMVEHGFTGFVAHCTKTSLPAALRYGAVKADKSFGLLVRHASASSPPPATPEGLQEHELASLIDMDAKYFGLRRASWLMALYRQDSSEFVVLRQGAAIVAFAILRDRADSAKVIDVLCYSEPQQLERLMGKVFSQFSHRALHCFVAAGSLLEKFLIQNGFYEPGFYQSIGPMMEVRFAAAVDLPIGRDIQTLQWL